jgi:hypothetical protein
MLLWWREPTWKTVNLIKAVDLISEIRGPTILLSPSFYLCNVCRAIFGNKADLNRHILTHAGSAKGGGEGCILNVECQEGHAGGRDVVVKAMTSLLVCLLVLTVKRRFPYYLFRSDPVTTFSTIFEPIHITKQSMVIY